MVQLRSHEIRTADTDEEEVREVVTNGMHHLL